MNKIEVLIEKWKKKQIELTNKAINKSRTLAEMETYMNQESFVSDFIRDLKFLNSIMEK